MKPTFPLVLCGLAISLKGTPAIQLPSGSGSWLWEKDDALNGVMFLYYTQYEGSYNELVLCVIQCLQIRECQSFTVSTTGQVFNCRFHSRRFSFDEISYLGNAQNGLEYYAIRSNCPVTDSHFMSREAKMCVSINTSKRTKAAAESYCNSMGAKIVTIDSTEKEAFIADVMTQVSSWTNICFHTDAQASGGVYQWADGADVSTDLLDVTYDPLNQCVEVIYDGPGKLRGQLYDCDVKKIAVICQFPL